MDSAWRIRDWNLHFENNESRKLKRCAWVKLPNKQDGRGYRRLVALKNGAALFGCWVALVEVASKCHVRGVFADEHGPLSIEDLAFKTGMPEGLIGECLQTLSSPQFMWFVPPRRDDLPEHRDDLPERREVLPESPETSGLARARENGTERNGMEGNRRERKGTEKGVASATLSSSQANCDGSSRTPAAEIEAVVRHYRSHHPRANPGAKERRLIAARLHEGYTVADLCHAIDGNHFSPHHCGQNETGTEYHALELIVRDSSKVAAFIEHYERGPQPILSKKSRVTATAAQQYVEMMRTRGEQTHDVDE